MKCIAKLLTVLFLIAPMFALAAVTLKAEGQVRTRIIAFTNENNIVDSVVKNIRSYQPIGNFNNTAVGINITKQGSNVVNVAVTF